MSKWDEKDVESTKEIFRETNKVIDELLRSGKYDSLQIAGVFMVQTLSLYKEILSPEEYADFISHVVSNSERITAPTEYIDDDDDEITLH
jgi:hypothetical protein